MQHRVATSFLRYKRDILILKRSASVKTMRGLWSAVSGTIEPGESPLERAMIEIYEETKVSSKEITLAGSGQITLADTPDYGDTWMIHPFLFNVRHKNIRLNWENDEYRWVPARDIIKYDTVPKLYEILDSML